MERFSDEASDAIQIRGLELSVRIGVPDKERAEPQRLTLSMRLWPSTGFHDLGDELSRTIDYAAVCRQVKEFAARRTDRLIETLADEIASDLLRTFPLRRVRLELRKFILPDVKYVAVTLTREPSSGR